MSAIVRKVIESTLVDSLFSNFRWYRKLHGGRWERWWILPCQGPLWLAIGDGTADDHRQPASEGPRMGREDYP